MSQVKLEANIREKTGKGVARKLRRQGRVPAVLYGHHLEQPIVLDLDAKEMERVLNTAGRTSIINLNVTGNDGSTIQTAMLADYQRDVFGTMLVHVDFKQVRLDEMVTAAVPVVLVGYAKGVKAGGVLEQILREISVEALPMDIPEHLEIDITNMEMGEHLTVADIHDTGTLNLLAEPDETVAVIHTPRAVTLAEEKTAEVAVAAPAE